MDTGSDVVTMKNWHQAEILFDKPAFFMGKVLHKLPFTVWCRVWTRQRFFRKGWFVEDKLFSDFPHCNPTKLCVSELSRCADLYLAMCATGFNREGLTDLQMTETSQSSVCTHMQMCVYTHTHNQKNTALWQSMDLCKLNFNKRCTDTFWSWRKL